MGPELPAENTLPETDQTRALTARITAAGDADIVLTTAEEALYQLLVDDINRVWSDGSAQERWTY